MTTRPRLSPDQRARLERLRAHGVLTSEQVTAVLDELDPERNKAAARGGAVWEVLGYLGAALVLGGASLLVGMSWDDLTRPARVSLLVGATAALALSGLVIAGGPRDVLRLPSRERSRRTRIVSVLFALASCTAALAAGSGFDKDTNLLATGVGLIVALLGYAVARGLAGLLAAAAFSVGVVVSGTELWLHGSTPWMTTGLVVLGALWTTLAITGLLGHRQPLLAVGIVIALVGTQYPLGSSQPWWGYYLTLLIALLCFGGYLAERAVVLLVLGVLGITVSVPEAVWDWTGGTLGGPLVILLVGVVFLAAAGIGWRLRHAEHVS